MKELACHEDNNLTSLDSQQLYTGNSEENMATNVVQADPEEEVFAFVAPNELSLSEENAHRTRVGKDFVVYPPMILVRRERVWDPEKTGIR